MNNELQELLIIYNKITLELVHSLEEESYDYLDELFEKRQMAINAMNNLSYSKEEFSTICEKLGLVDNQKKLDIALNSKRQRVRAELEKISTSKTANKSYSKNFNVDSLFFNKKI